MMRGRATATRASFLAVATFLVLSSASLGASDLRGGPGGSGPRPTPAGSPSLAQSSPTPSTPALATPGPATSEPFDDETVLAGFAVGTSLAEIRSIAGAVGASHVDSIGAGTQVLRVPKGQVLTTIAALKFLNANGSGSTSGAVSAIDWAVRAKQAGVNVRVLSNSWGGGGFSQALLDEINKAGANDILFVAAAGNYGASNDTTPLYPCSYHTANEICVA